MSSSLSESNAPSSDAPKQALFFHDPQLLSLDRHAQAGLRRERRFDFAKEANSIPVVVDEMAEVARSYPIVFSQDPVPMPVAVLGLRNQNLFVDEAGAWDPNHHVPFYAQKYPFALVALGEGAQFALCVDEASAQYQDAQPDMPFYQQDQATPFAQEALETCRKYQDAHGRTQAFARAIAANDLLAPKRVQVQRADKTIHALDGFTCLDEEKWLALDDAEKLNWVKNGYAAMLYLVLASQANWKYLAAR